MNSMEFADNYKKPIAKISYVRSNFDLYRPIRVSKAPDWDEIERALREVLEELASAVKGQRPGTVLRFGSNRSEAVIQYTYCVFESGADVDAEPIVVGVACKRILDKILVRGDFCEEDSGIVRYQSPGCRMEVPKVHREVMSAASAVVARLAREKALLIALLDGSEIG